MPDELDDELEEELEEDVLLELLELEVELELLELDELELLDPDTERTTMPLRVPLSVVAVTSMVRLVSFTVVLKVGE